MDLTSLSHEALEEYVHNLEAIAAEQDELLTILAEAIPRPTSPSTPGEEVMPTAPVVQP
jgi:hypothetical protein